MVKNIIFDLGQVIAKVDLNPFLFQFGREFNINAVELTKDESDGAHKDFMVGKIKGEEFHKITCERFNHFISIEKFKAIWVSMLVGEIDGVSEIVLKLHQQKYPLALLSNTDPWHYEYCEQNLPVLQKFNKKFLSYDLKMKKPDPDIFLTVIKRLETEPQQCIFIDDARENIQSAQNLNFQAILFQNSMQLRHDLNELGIEI